jgi:6-bladed beta-propeller protein
MGRQRSRCALVVAMTLASCTPTDSATDGAQSNRTVIGDTTIVRTAGAGNWGESATLVEELSIGVLDGSDEYQFGFVSAIAVDGEGGIYVFDGQVPALRYYDSSGMYVRTLGGKGEGPGEYQDAALGMAVRRGDGRLVMRDPRNMRMNVYNPDGSSSDSWRVESGLFTSAATALDASDHMYLKILTGRPEPNKPWPVALLHMDDAGGIIDTIIPPVLPNEPEEVSSGVFGVAKVWALSASGGFVVGVNDAYVIDHYRTDGTVLRMTRDIQPVAVLPEEKAEREDRNAWMRRTDPSRLDEIPPVPDVKPMYRSILAGEGGRLWVRRYVEAEKGEVVQGSARPGMEAPPPTSWREPVVYDVFEVDGSFLGAVRVPPRTSISVIRGDRVWGVRRGEFNESYVVGLRLSLD